jgi:hypothetical protein
MGIRLAGCATLALALLALAVTSSHRLPAQEAPRTKIDLPRDDVDKIVLEEAKRDKGRAIVHLKEKIQELDRQHDQLVYELINLRAKLKRAVGGLAELDPGQVPEARRVRADVGGTAQRSKDAPLRPMPSPRTARERDEALKKYEDQAALAAELGGESSQIVKHLREGMQGR